jgi:hypothetical protein
VSGVDVSGFISTATIAEAGEDPSKAEDNVSCSSDFVGADSSGDVVNPLRVCSRSSHQSRI